MKFLHGSPIFAKTAPAYHDVVQEGRRRRRRHRETEREREREREREKSMQCVRMEVSARSMLSVT